MADNKINLGRVIITGGCGFYGKHLVKHIREYYPKTEILIVDISAASNSFSSKELVMCDVLDAKKISKAIVDFMPDIIFHLAGSFLDDNLTLLYQLNVIGTVNVLRAASVISKNIRVILSSSAALYGLVSRKNNPVIEETEVKPINHHGISKAAMEMVSKIYMNQNNLDIIISRTFNLIGEGISPSLLMGRLLKVFFCNPFQDQERIITVGNTDSIRDFIDVRDAVEALTLLSIKGKRNNIYNIGSGIGTKVGDFINLMVKNYHHNIKIVKDDNLLRRNDPAIIIADIVKIKNCTGWVPSITLEKSVSDSLRQSE